MKAVENGDGEKKAYREAEAAEHAELWRRSPKFRAAVEQRLKGPKAARKATGKR
jgi:hypothetical protein